MLSGSSSAPWRRALDVRGADFERLHARADLGDGLASGRRRFADRLVLF